MTRNQAASALLRQIQGTKKLMEDLTLEDALKIMDFIEEYETGLNMPAPMNKKGKFEWDKEDQE